MLHIVLCLLFFLETLVRLIKKKCVAPSDQSSKILINFFPSFYEVTFDSFKVIYGAFSFLQVAFF